MSIKAMVWVWENSPYTLGQRLVHLALADVANDAYDNELWMVTQAIADKTAMSKRQVIRTLHLMVEDGYLEVLEEGGGRGKATRYRLIMKGCQNVILSDGNGDISDTERVTFPTTTPITNARKTQRAETRAIEGSVGVGSMVGFDHFWEAYPKRNGRKLGRGLCEKRWVKMSLDDKRAAYRGAVNYAKDCDGGLTIAKDPDRWLRDGLWEDWQLTVDRNPTTVSTPEDPMNEDYYL